MTIFKAVISIRMSLSHKNPREKLLSRMPKDSICAEVGVWKGDFSEKILKETQPQRLYLIDPWQFQPDFEQALYGGKDAENQSDMEKIYCGIEKKFENEISENKIVLLRGFSEQMFKEIRNGSLDWIYIDGNHTYEFAKKDLAYSLEKVKEGGFVTGDDYCEGSWWKGGVKKAVDEVIDQKLVKSYRIMGNQFILRKF